MLKKLLTIAYKDVNINIVVTKNTTKTNPEKWMRKMLKKVVDKQVQRC